MPINVTQHHRVRRVARLVAVALWAIPPGCGPTQSLPPQTIPNGVAGSTYEHKLNVQNGASEQSWMLEAGNLPPGLALDEDGVIAGIPSRAGGFTFTVSLRSGGPSFQHIVFDVAMTILEPVRVADGLSDAQVAVPYEDTLHASGGVPPYTFEVVGLPAGLDFDGEAGTVFGTALHDEDALPLQITVTDKGAPQQRVTEIISLRIQPAPVVLVTGELPGGQVAVFYSQRLEASGGRTPYAWAITDGLLPPGVRLDLGGGLLFGTPTAAGVWEFTIQVRDSYTPVQSAARSFEVEIQ